MGRPQFFTIDPSHQLARGLVFAGLGNATGSSRYHDSSLIQNHGSLLGVIPVTDWRYSQELQRNYLSLDGDDAYVAAPTIATTNVLTAAAWVKIEGTQTTTTGILAKWNGSAGSFRSWALLRLAADTIAVYLSGNGTYQSANSVVSPSALDGSRLHHVAFTYQTTIGTKLYFDGIEVASNATSPANLKASTYPTWVGRQFGNDAAIGDEVLQGCVADPLIYHRRLTEKEIQQLADPSNYMLSGLIRPIGQIGNVYDPAGIR